MNVNGKPHKATLRGRRVLLHVDLNYPFEYRIASILPTIQALLRGGAQVVLVSHLDKEGAAIIAQKHLSSKARSFHLDLLARGLKKYFPHLVYVPGKIRPMPKHFFKNRKPALVLLDNLRLDAGEVSNDPRYARILASWGEYFINDAFSVSHRSHASIMLLPNLLPHAMGPLMKKEIHTLSRFFKPQHPFLVIIGGKKYSTKEPLLARFLKTADAVFLGGVLANTFLHQRGVRTGKSAMDGEKIPQSILRYKKILLPEDVVVLRGRSKKMIPVSEVRDNDYIYDAGPRTVARAGAIAQKSKLVLWNGTLGYCEIGFNRGSDTLAKLIGKSRAYKVVGGGDTVAEIRRAHLEKNFDFISTGGGAMLEFLAKGTLPGIEALQKKK